VKAALALILVLAVQTCSASRVRTQFSNLVGRWKVDITFTNTVRHSLRFDAQASGKGSFLVQDSRSSLVEPAAPSDAKWARSGEKGVTFSGPVEFPIGNVGRDQGTLVFKGTFETEDLISGDLAFFPMDQDPKDPKAIPSKTGTFKATRVSADDAPR
jgi:hypothetical protein